jgi:voltage-gated potassium channel
VLAKRSVKRSVKDEPAQRDYSPLRLSLQALYHGQTPEAVRFRIGVLAVDLVLIAFFILTPILRSTRGFLVIDYGIAVLLAVDLWARAMASPSMKQFFLRPMAWVDLVVLGTLLFPQWISSLAFLRALRLWTVFNSDFFWETVARRLDDSRWEDVTRSAVTLVTFVFVATGFVYGSFAGRHSQIDGYLDALYFTVTTLTTTGFGDIVLPGPWGRAVSIAIMISGITLFVRLAQALLRPYKVRFPCPSCGLVRHDPDAVHCKACGLLLNIPNEE